MRELITAFIIVFTLQIVTNKPALPEAQASNNSKTSISSKQSPQKAQKKKVVKHDTKKQKPVKQAQKQPVVVHKSVPKLVAVSNSGSVASIITSAAARHGIDPQRALRIATCESGLNVMAQNTGYYAGGGHPTGLFQYLPETWNRIGSRSPYGVGNIYSAKDQANVTMWAWANGYAGEWECQ